MPRPTHSLPAPVLEEHCGILVVRDDLIPGGTKQRVLPQILPPGNEYVYASPACGYAQVALAYTCERLGKRATIFTAARKIPHARTLEAAAAGAVVVPVKCGYLSVVQAAARRYCQETGAILMPFGFDSIAFLDALAGVARGLPIRPQEVWTVAGSGTLSRALQLAWPTARVYAVQVGKVPDVGRAELYVAPEKFEQGAKVMPPFPSCANYDAKAWAFIQKWASPGSLFWNVAR